MVPALATDMYQLTMVQSYLEHGMLEPASFEFFVRKLPENRNYLLACGLQPLLQTLTVLHFTRSELRWLEATGRFSQRLVDWLADFRFDGDVDAMMEGTPFFANEPILRVTASLPVAQLVETHVINLLQLPTMIASKAARQRTAAPDKLLVDFGLRRAHSLAAGIAAARAGFIGGLDGTSNMQAGHRYAIPVFGTMAHSFVQAHDDEYRSFLDFSRSHPDNSVLLIDTYDTERGARKVVEAARELAAEGIRIRGVRIDSGDLAAASRQVRGILDAAGLQGITIFTSGNLDEYRLQALTDADAPIDGYGIGTKLDTSADAPYLDCAYKLQAYAGEPKWKESPGKQTLPDCKQVYRHMHGGAIQGDTLATVDERENGGEPLLQPVMREGRRLARAQPLKAIRRQTAEQIAALPPQLRALQQAPAFPVRISPKLQALCDRCWYSG